MCRLLVETGISNTSHPSASPSPSDRLLVLSAGLDNAAGAPLQRFVIAAAAEAGIDVTEDNPCARFHIMDLDMFDLIVCLDRGTRDRVLEMAKMAASGPDTRSVDAALFVGGFNTPESRYAGEHPDVLLLSLTSWSAFVCVSSKLRD